MPEQQLCHAAATSRCTSLVVPACRNQTETILIIPQISDHIMFTRRQLVVWGMRSAYQNGCRQVNYQGGNGDTKGDMSRQWGRPDTTCVHLGEGSTLETVATTKEETLGHVHCRSPGPDRQCESV